MKAFTVVTLLAVLVSRSEQHGRLYNPPSRSTAWRLGFDTPPNYTDNELNCGGYSNQWQNNGGMCGECGDPYEMPIGQRPNQAGGTYATGTIVGTYQPGQLIDVTLQITAMHWGWYEFRLCPVANKDEPALWECFNENLLEFADGTTRYEIPSEYTPGEYVLQVRLPDITCDQCVFQWLWHCGNSWGVDPDGTECVGCGAQETFMGCADISITSDGAPPATDPPASTEAPATNPPGETTTTTTAGPTTTTTTPPEPTPSPWPSQIPNIECEWIGDSAGTDQWCVDNCANVPSNCDDELCRCWQVPA